MLIGILILVIALGEAKEVEVEFKIVPNKAGDVEVALDTPPIPSSTCRFEWDSSGATVEVRSFSRGMLILPLIFFIPANVKDNFCGRLSN